jgi:replicative DNA helicase
MMLPRVENGIRQVSNLPLHVSFGRLSTSQIITRLRQAIALEKRKPSVVFIDRLEMLADSDCAALEETKRIPILSARVKGIATTLDVPVVCLCQLNRAGREGTPTGESFRASGAIEQDCQVGLIVKTDKAANTSTLYVVKQNDGQTGSCEVLHFDARLPMFLEVAR